MPSLTIENYVKAIYQLTYAEKDKDRAAATGALAAALHVSPSSVTSMLKTLHDSGLAEHRPYEGARLTEKGKLLALRVLRRHRLIELFLVQTLNLSWDEVHEEAEHMEHAVSDLLIDRIDQFLNFPELDPHGDPIPRSDGSMTTTQQTPLSECCSGSPMILQRVLDQSSEFLRFLSEGRLEIGALVEVLHNEQISGTVTVRTNGHELTLGHVAASRLMMRPLANEVEVKPESHPVSNE
jgi:DtxR family transcriptional regulator, Mn-dependent transcriptional regulator